MGKLWGISGMFLSVPIIVVLIIILNNFKQTKNIAILLSEKGNLK
jgi:predicted PurR-regulated permease PerM